MQERTLATNAAQQSVHGERPMSGIAPEPVGTMRAMRIHRQGGPEGLVYEEAPRPSPARGDVLVRVHAAGISPAEFTWSIWTTPDGRGRLPLIPGHEVSGVVAALGPGATSLAVGDEVYR